MFASESDARTAPQAALLPGCGIHIHENGNTWHYRLEYGPMCVIPTSDGFFALISSNLNESGRGYGPWTKVLPPAKSPKEAVQDAIRAFAERMEDWMKIAEVVHK